MFERERNNKLMTLQAAIALISHEINQPLGTIVLNAEAAQPILQVDPPNLEEVRLSVRNEPAKAQVRLTSRVYQTTAQMQI